MLARYRGLIFIIILFVVIGLVVEATVSYFNSFGHLTVRYTNVQSVDIHASSDPSSTVASVTYSGQTIKLRQGSYVLSYTGKTDYANGSIAVDLSQKQQTVTINPPYSDQKLSSLLSTESPAIQMVLTQKYPHISLYKIQLGKLYHTGDWYGTTLVYTGSDIFNSDTLRVVLHKQNGTWVVATDPPNITLSKLLFPNVPEDVLVDVNNMP